MLRPASWDCRQAAHPSSSKITRRTGEEVHGESAEGYLKQSSSSTPRHQPSPTKDLWHIQGEVS
jgi:hypothetical protein